MISKWLLNPFRYISGWPALALGLFGLTVMALISSATKVHLDGVLDVHFGHHGNFWLYFLENLTVWGSLILVFGATGLILRRATFRFIDLSAYMALMQLPFIIAVLLPFITDPTVVTDHILHTYLGHGSAVDVTTLDIAGFIFMLLIIIAVLFWSLLWGFFAFKTLFNQSGLKAAAIYAMVIILAEAVSLAGIHILLRGILLNV